MRPARISLLGIALLPLLLAAAQAPQERFVEQIEVRVADVDVVVTDRNGNPLTDLARDDFELYENGKRVEIAYFARIVEGRLEQEAGNEDPEAAPDAVEAPAPRAPLTWAVFVDQRNLRLAGRTEALRRLRAFLDRALAEGDRAIVASYDGLAFRVRGGFTTEKKKLLATISGIERERLVSSLDHTEGVALRSDRERSAAAAAALGARENVEGAALDAQASTMTQAEVERQSAAIAALRALVDVMAGMEGRQAVVYVGTGFDTSFAAAEGGEPTGRSRDRTRLEKEVTDLFARASASRVTFYTIFAGETGSGMMAEETGSSSMTGAPNAAVRETSSQMAAARELADRTGGIAFKVNANLDRQLDAVARDLTHYYSLGYVPEGPAGRQRKLTVKVNVDGARVRYRESLRERTPDERASDSVVAALFNPHEANPLGMSIEVEPARRAGVGRRIAVRVKVPLSSLAFLRQNDVHHGGVTIHVALAGPDGTVWRLESREQPLAIPHAELASALGKHITYGFEIPQQARGMRMAVSVQDRFAPQIASTITIPLESGRR